MCRDVNRGNQTGFMVPRVNLYEGVRGDTYRSYLRPVRDRNNLTILKNGRVLRYRVHETVHVLLNKGFGSYCFNFFKDLFCLRGSSPSLP